MPNYSYKCSNCQNVLEISHGMNEKPQITCNSCGSNSVSKLISGGTGFILKGSGFYTTDYKRKEEQKTAPVCNSAPACENKVCPAAKE